VAPINKRIFPNINKILLKILKKNPRGLDKILK
jgi:hypothetical protein